MNEQDQPQQSDVVPAPAGGVMNPNADQLHQQLVQDFQTSVQADLPGAIGRWGYTWLHSLPDEEAMSLRQQLGFHAVDALDHYNQGCLLAAREDYAGAVEAFQRARELDPELDEAWFNQALALELAGQTAKAREAWKAYLDQHGDLPEEEARQIKDRLAALAGS